MNTVIQLLDEQGIKWTTSHKDVRQGWAAFLDGCPWCGRRGGELYLSVNLHSGITNCWRCGPHGLADVIVALRDIPLREAIAITRGLVLRPAEPYKPTGRLKVPLGVGPLLPCHQSYLAGRGLDWAECVRLWGLGGIGLEARLKWRIYIPVTDAAGRVVSWTTRAIGNVEKRYHAASPDEEAYSAKRLIYGEEHAQHTIIVHEGPADVWTTGPGAGAVMGLSVTDEQVLRIASYLRRVICFDAEPEARKRADRLARRLAAFPGETEVAHLETGNDPNGADPSEIAELRAAYL